MNNNTSIKNVAAGSRTAKLHSILASSLAAITLITAPQAMAVTKANNQDNLTLGSSWVGGVAPGSGDIALWDSTVTASNNVNLGGNATWLGLQVTNPASSVFISGTAVQSLTLGASGITASNTVGNVNIYSNVILSSNQTWTSSAQTFLVGSAPSSATVTNGGFTLGIANAGGNNFRSNLVGAGGLTKTGAGVLTLSGNNTYTGNTIVNGGTVQLGASGTTGSLSASSVISGTGNNIFQVNRTDNLTLANTISGDVQFQKYEANTLTLTGASDFVRETKIRAGILSVSSINSVTTNATLGTVHSATSNLGAPITASNGTISIGTTTTTGQLTYTGSGETTDRVINLNGTTGGATLDQSGTGVFKLVSTLSASGLGNKTLTLQGATAGTGEISGAILNSTGFNTALAKAGTGTWALSGNNTFTGTTTISGGTLQLGSGGTTGRLATTGAIVNNANLTINRSNAVAQGTDFSTAAITGSGSLTQSGTGATTLNVANTYGGGTTVTAGTLVLADNSAAGTAGIAVSGSSSATLQINSGITIANNITFSNTNAGSLVNRQVANASSYSVGTSGSLASSFVGGQADTSASILAGTNAQGSTTTLSMRFSDTSAASNDASRISDVFSLSGTSTDLFVLQLNVTGLGASSQIAWLSGGSWINAVAGNTGNNASLAQQGFLGSFSSFQGTYGSTLSSYVGAYGVDTIGGATWAVLNHNSDFAAVPEPTTWALLAFSLTAVMVLRRRRA